jgi:hypothetical protein
VLCCIPLKKGEIMPGKKILLAVVSLGLLVASVSFAQDMSDFQKQMMQQMMQQNMQKFQQGGTEAPGFAQRKEVADKGRALFNDSSLGTNGKSCGSCHQEGQAPLDGRVVNHYLAAYVQYCYEHALAGKKVIDKDKLDQIMSYFGSLRVAKSATQTKMPAPMEEESW